MLSDSSSVPAGLPPVVAPKKPAPNNVGTVPWGAPAAIFYALGVAFLGAQLLVGLALGVYLAALFHFNEAQLTSWFETIPGQFIYTFLAEMLMLALIILYVRAKKGTPAMLGLNRLQWKYVGFALLGIGVYIVGYILILSVASTLIPSLNLDQEQDIGFKNPNGLHEYAMVFLSLVVLPPVVEEIMFRGFMYAGLRRRLPFVIAAICTSILFAIGHLQIGNGQPLLWVAAIDTFVLSMVMCFIREKTGSIWPTIFMHVIKNGVAFTFLYLVK